MPSASSRTPGISTEFISFSRLYYSILSMLKSGSDLLFKAFLFSRVLHPALSVGWSVGYTLLFFIIFFTSLLLPKWSSDLKYGPCPPARYFGSRVSGLVFFSLGIVRYIVPLVIQKCITAKKKSVNNDIRNS